MPLNGAPTTPSSACLKILSVVGLVALMRWEVH